MRCNRIFSHRDRTAFTLAELAIVTLILSVLAAVAVPQYMSAIIRYQADCAARRIKIDLEYMQQEARRTSASKVATFRAADATYAFAGITDLNRPTQSTYTVNLSASPYYTELVSVDFGGDSVLVFDGYGKPDSAGSIVIRSGSVTKTINVTSFGQVTIL